MEGGSPGHATTLQSRRLSAYILYYGKLPQSFGAVRAYGAAVGSMVVMVVVGKKSETVFFSRKIWVRIKLIV